MTIYARRCQTKAGSTKLPLDTASERARIGAFRLQHPELGQSSVYPLARMPLRWRAHLWAWRVAPLFSSPPYYLEPSAGPGPRPMWETYRQRFQCHLGLGFSHGKTQFWAPNALFPKTTKSAPSCGGYWLPAIPVVVVSARLTYVCRCVAFSSRSCVALYPANQDRSSYLTLLRDYELAKKQKTLGGAPAGALSSSGARCLAWGV